MLLVPAISALVLLESRDVFNGLLSQPFAAALLLITAGHDPISVLLTASVIQLLYLNRQPSGASLYPEYPFAFFMISASAPRTAYSGAVYISAILLIILTSVLTSYFLKFKRSVFEKHRDKLVFYHKIPNFLTVVFYSYIFYFAYSAALHTAVRALLELTVHFPGPPALLESSPFIPILLCLTLSLYYLFLNLRSKNE